MRLCRFLSLAFGLYLAGPAVMAAQEQIRALPNGAVKSFTHGWHVSTLYSFPKASEFSIANAQGWNLKMLVPIPASDETLAVSNLQIGDGLVKSFSGAEGRYIAYMFTAVPQDFTVEYDVEISEYRVPLSGLEDLPPYDTGSRVYRTYTKNTTGQIDVKHPKIKQYAAELWEKAKGNRLDYAYKAFIFTYEHMPYAVVNYNSIDDMYRLGTNGKPTGDCGAHAIYYVSLLRSHGIPARLKTGWLTKDGTLSGHMWSEFYVEGIGWVPSDATFGGNYFNRSGPNSLHFNRGEELRAEIGDWKPVFTDGLQNFAWVHGITGGTLSGTLAIRSKITVRAIHTPDEAAYYQDPERAEKLRDSITAMLRSKLAIGQPALHRSPELDRAGDLMISDSKLKLDDALKQGGFRQNGGIYVLDLALDFPAGTDIGAGLLRYLEANGYIKKYLIFPKFGVGYRYENNLHRFYLISSGGK